jgi:hypothetical protein
MSNEANHRGQFGQRRERSIGGDGHIGQLAGCRALACYSWPRLRPLPKPKPATWLLGGNRP